MFFGITSNKLQKNQTKLFMKKIAFIFAFLLLSLCITEGLFAQRFQDCSGQAMSSMAFQSRKQQIAQVRDFQRLQLAKQLLQETCLLSSQVKEIVELFGDDFAKLDFAKNAYLRTIDRPNFYEVYNGFTYFSTVFMLHDYVDFTRGAYNPNDNPNPSNPINPNPTNPTRVVSFPNHFYPNPANYQGTIKCNSPVNENTFMQMAQEVFNFNDENARVGRLNELLQSNCYTTSQVMRFASLIAENNRLSYLKIAYNKVFDANNYNQTTQLFLNQANQQSILTFIQQDGGFVPNNPSNPVNPNPACSVPNADFEDMRTRINKESFPNTRLNLAKTIIRTRTCFSVTQIRTLVTLMRQDNERLDLAKFAYDYCNQPERINYFQLSDVFTFNRAKEDFMAFLQTKR